MSSKGTYTAAFIIRSHRLTRSSISFSQPSASTTPSCSWPTGSSVHPSSTPRSSRRLTSPSPHQRSLKSHGTQRPTPSHPTLSSPAGYSPPSSSQNPTSSSSVAGRLACSPSTRTGKRQRFGSLSALANPKRCLFHPFVFFPLFHIIFHSLVGSETKAFVRKKMRNCMFASWQGLLSDRAATLSGLERRACFVYHA